MAPTENTDSTLVAKLHDEVGDALRVVAQYRNGDYDVNYMRGDVESRYSGGQMDEIFEDLVIQGIHKARLEELFSAGGLECSLFKFEESLMFHFTPEEGRGLFVTVDSDAGIDIEAFAATCEGFL